MLAGHQRGRNISFQSGNFILKVCLAHANTCICHIAFCVFSPPATSPPQLLPPSSCAPDAIGLFLLSSTPDCQTSALQLPDIPRPCDNLFQLFSSVLQILNPSFPTYSLSICPKCKFSFLLCVFSSELLLPVPLPAPAC